MPVSFTLNLPQVVMSQPCSFSKLGSSQSLLCSIVFDILSYGFKENLVIKMFHPITIKKYKQEHLKCMCAIGR